MNGLLFSLPGTPVIYYGDEIGMGDNIYLGDRNGVRTPMQWSADRNAGFSRANPQRLYLPVIIDPEYHYEAVNVEAQQTTRSSLLWWMQRLIALRKRYQAFGRGSIEFLHPDNPKVLAFLRAFEDERILVVANLSRFVPVRRARPAASSRGIDAGRAVRTHRVPADRRAALLPHPGPARVLLVRLAAPTRRPRRRDPAGEPPRAAPRGHVAERLCRPRPRRLERALPARRCAAALVRRQGAGDHGGVASSTPCRFRRRSGRARATGRVGALVRP